MCTCQSLVILLLACNNREIFSASTSVSPESSSDDLQAHPSAAEHRKHVRMRKEAMGPLVADSLEVPNSKAHSTHVDYSVFAATVEEPTLFSATRHRHHHPEAVSTIQSSEPFHEKGARTDYDVDVSSMSSTLAQAVAAVVITQLKKMWTTVRKARGAFANLFSNCDDNNFDGVFDLVITWWTDRPQNPSAQSLIQQLGGSLNRRIRIENQREILYLLRGAQKYGVLHHVRNVFVMVDHGVLEEFGPPRSLNWTHPRLHLVPHTCATSRRGKTDCGYLSKLASVHRIKGISDWILVLQDDIFPTQPFQLSAIYDQMRGRPLIRMGVDKYVEGWCDSGFASLNHGPWFVSRCRLEEVEQQYPNRFSEAREATSTKDTADAQCLYDNFAANRFATMVEESEDSWGSFLKMCHFNSLCTAAYMQYPTRMFTNIQGDGVSEEYTSNSKVNSAMLRWFEKMYPTPSMFEMDSGMSVDRTDDRGTVA